MAGSPLATTGSALPCCDDEEPVAKDCAGLEPQPKRRATTTSDKSSVIAGLRFMVHPLDKDRRALSENSGWSGVPLGVTPIWHIASRHFLARKPVRDVPLGVSPNGTPFSGSLTGVTVHTYDYSTIF